jgi:sarcosine oxidase subunit alpha
MTLDGATVVAEEGEPIAHALLGSGVLALARSPKFHRPRGPSCLRAACDGCLMRVDGLPNVMTCFAPARAGTEVHSQNTLGSRRVDLLRVTDWFFPDGINHHELFAGVPGVQGVMQAFARRVAGLGRMPDGADEARDVRRAKRRAADVLVVGGGPAGLAAAARLAESGRTVEVVDDALAIGGSLLALGRARASEWSALDARIERAVARGRLAFRSSTIAGAVFPDGVLVVGREGAEIVEPATLVLASGAHDGVLAFEGNDVPGIFSARAGLKLLAAGIAVGERVVVALAPGGGPFGAMFRDEVAHLGAPIEVTVVEGEPFAVHGSAHVKEVVFRDPSGEEQKHKADALLVDAPRAPAYELAAQAGAALEHRPSGFVVRAAETRVARGIYAVGEVVGTPLAWTAIEAEAEQLARAVAAELAGGAGAFGRSGAFGSPRSAT